MCEHIGLLDLPVLVFPCTTSTPCGSAIFRARGEALIAAADERNVAMVFTAQRHFRH